MGQNSPILPVNPAKFTNVVGATAGQQIATGQGILRGFSVNTVGSSSTLVFYDGTSTAGTKIGTWTTVAQTNVPNMDIQFKTGLFVVTTGTLSDITVRYSQS